MRIIEERFLDMMEAILRSDSKKLTTVSPIGYNYD